LTSPKTLRLPPNPGTIRSRLHGLILPKRRIASAIVANHVTFSVHILSDGPQLVLRSCRDHLRAVDQPHCGAWLRTCQRHHLFVGANGKEATVGGLPSQRSSVLGRRHALACRSARVKLVSEEK
jgi:hypothetical protein